MEAPSAAPATPTSVPSTALPARPCPAKEKDPTGCAGDTHACQNHRPHASPTDREARVIHDAGHDAKHGEKQGSKDKGHDVFGYRSIVERVLDERFAVAWTVRRSLDPANTDERRVFSARVRTLRAALPNLPIGEWLDDSGAG